MGNKACCQTPIEDENQMESVLRPTPISPITSIQTNDPSLPKLSPKIE